MHDQSARRENGKEVQHLINKGVNMKGNTMGECRSPALFMVIVPCVWPGDTRNTIMV
jgi:hypothetical protein